jgi:HAE1 family hydrophobic/amphiphilic exporter-1
MNRSDKMIYLDQVTDFKYGLGPSEIWRKNKTRMIQVSANIGRVPLSKAADMAKAALADLKLPEGYYFRIGGNYPTMMATQKQFRAIIWLIVILIFLVLASLFESLIQPFIIMVSVPLALIGVTIALYATGKSVGMGVLVGLMMLGGIVVNNGIILIAHANNLRAAKMNYLKAVILASRDRLRPILMTTITTLLGLLPMAISNQEGANLWSPLAITVMGGLISSTLLTLLIIPSVYVAAEHVQIRLRRFLASKKVKETELIPKHE